MAALRDISLSAAKKSTDPRLSVSQNPITTSLGTSSDSHWGILRAWRFTGWLAPKESASWSV